MTVFQALLLGFVQGLTEFLPVSSSGHLIFIPKFLGWADQGFTFDMFINIGTLIAVMFFFRKKLMDIAKSLFLYKKKDAEDLENRKLFALMILATIPAVIAGLTLSNWIETSSRSSLIIGIDMIFWGIVLGIAEWYGQKNKKASQKIADVSSKHAAFMGLSQVLAAVFPGTSRSGITITAGIFSGLSKKTAAEFSFLMSIPVIALACASDVLKILQYGTQGIGGTPLFVGLFSAMISGFFALSFLMKIIEKWSLKPFVVYRVIIGVLILVLL